MLMELPIFVEIVPMARWPILPYLATYIMCLCYTFPFRGSLLKMHVEADKYNSGALVQKYEAGIKGFFKDEELVGLTMFLHLI